MQSIDKIHDIDPIIAARLRNAGISTVVALRKAAVSRVDCVQIAERAGVPEELMDRIISQAELMRIDGIGWQLACLLVNAGVVSLSDLAVCDAISLRDLLQQANSALNVTRQIPSIWRIEELIERARGLQRGTAA